MIKLEGRTTADVDEFMLRLGHLKIVSWVASSSNGARHRLEGELTEVLTRPTEVADDDMEWVSRYLDQKRLCNIDSAPDSNTKANRRYPTLLVETSKSHGYTLRDVENPGSRPSVWWQDWCLAQPAVRSRTGSVTAHAKSGSKTGLSHIIDWAEQLDLLGRSGQASPEARLLGEFTSGSLADVAAVNPYVIGAELVILMWAVAQADTDIFTRFLTRLAAAPGVVNKRTAADCFMQTVVAIDDEADSARYLTASQVFQLNRQLRELERATRKSKSLKTVNSTVWHRASSRLESYVDLGLLQKGGGSEDEKFDFVYQTTEVLHRVVAAFREVETIEEWLEWKMVECLFGGVHRQEYLSRAELAILLPPIATAVQAPAAIPINTLALGLVVQAIRSNVAINLGTARESVERLARDHADVARLARGSSGQRPEFISINFRKL